MKTGACAILLEEGRILLGKRSSRRKFYPNVWDLIGGHCETGESPVQTLVRELEEELGIIPTTFQEVDILAEPDTETHGDYRYHVYLVTAWNGVPHNRQPQEHSELQWFSLEDALGLDVAHPHYPELFKKQAQSKYPAS